MIDEEFLLIFIEEWAEHWDTHGQYDSYWEESKLDLAKRIMRLIK